MPTLADTARRSAWLMLLLGSSTAFAASRVYVTNERSGELSVIDAERNVVVATLALGKRPRGLQVAPDGARLYVALSGSPIGGPSLDESKLPPPDKQADGIGVVDLASLRLERVLRGVSDPEQLAVASDGRRLYVASEDSAAVVVLDAQSGDVLQTIPVGHEPEGIGLTPDGRWVYVASEAEDQLSVIDVRHDAVVATIKVGSRPRGIVFAHRSPVAYVSCENGGVVSVIDTARRAITNSIQMPIAAARPMGMALSPNDATLYVATGRGHELVAIDTHTLQSKGSVEVGERPWGVSLSPDGRLLYTANGPSNDVTVIDANTLAVVKHIPVGAGPWGALAVRHTMGTTSSKASAVH